MTDFATTARPSRAAIAWATRDALFVELPCKDGPPYIARYRLTVEGLTSALNILLEAPDHTGAKPSAETAHPRVRRPIATFTDDQRAAAREILKNLKVI